MATHSVSGFPMMFMGRIGWAFGKILEAGGGGSFQVILDLRWGIAPRLNFNMTCGVGINPLR
jgi:hypothetical protein